jgi:ribosomal protein L32
MLRVARLQFGLAGVFGSINELASILWAVPKNKVPRSRIRQRLAAHLPKPSSIVKQCPVCRSPYLMGNICGNCIKNYVKTKLTEIGDEFKGKPIVKKHMLLQRIKKARGINNTARIAEKRNNNIK